MARLLALDNAASVPEDRRAHLAHVVRRPLLEPVTLSGEFFAPLMAAAVSGPDPGFCRWFIEPALYAFGRRRVTAALLDYERTGMDAGTTAGWLRRQCRDGLRRIRSTAALLMGGTHGTDPGPVTQRGIDVREAHSV
ncbi:hypothetical protein ACGFZQ_01350 [Streptomyces sp. NPDC048254]|uniref:hypothetical protein n=1 Tax=Streptomyces sp. NPDC048254 TaxID=3365525 RepID=UPI0037212A2E